MSMTREVEPLLEGHFLPPSRREQFHPREVYLDMPKGFGAVPAETLFEIADKLKHSSNARDLSVVGSAIIEATLFSPYRSPETTREDLTTMKNGIVYLEEAAIARWEELERGFLHYDDQTVAIRAEVAAAYGPVYMDMVEGRITNEARERTFSRLAYWGQYIMRLGDTHGSYGLAYEIATLMGGLTNEGVLLPATPRGDSGVYNPTATHDFTYVELDDDGFFKTSMPLELKNEGDEDRRFQNAARYSTSEVVMLEANTDLGIHKDDLWSIFNHRSMTWPVRRRLAGIRKGINARTSAAEREYGAAYNPAHTEEKASE
jgi:hypothetical protein